MPAETWWLFDDLAEVVGVDPIDELRYLESGGPDPALPWFRRKLLGTLAARAGAVAERDDAL